ncbi:hypothetical protein [Elizabethkingia miricola]|uniref:hypothetical protein n=1 Tax=Elizabethkingia miricola TaxID=172045 RepID=UPI003891F862
MEAKALSKLEVSDLFSFSKKSTVHMITRISGNHVEYKSYNDGKIRVYTELDRLVYTRKEYDNLYEVKHFKNNK